MRGDKDTFFEKQFATRPKPASQRSINEEPRLRAAPVEDNYAGDNWRVDSDALVRVRDCSHSQYFNPGRSLKRAF